MGQELSRVSRCREDNLNKFFICCLHENDVNKGLITPGMGISALSPDLNQEVITLVFKSAVLRYKRLKCMFLLTS